MGDDSGRAWCSRLDDEAASPWRVGELALRGAGRPVEHDVYQLVEEMIGGVPGARARGRPKRGVNALRRDSADGQGLESRRPGSRSRSDYSV
jgi:hypothetical protein